MLKSKIFYLILSELFNLIFYNRLFLGPCDSTKVDEIMKNSSEIGPPKVGLRFNTIEVNYADIANMPASGRTIKYHACAVRVDIYNSLSFELFSLFFN